MTTGLNQVRKSQRRWRSIAIVLTVGADFNMMSAQGHCMMSRHISVPTRREVAIAVHWSSIVWGMSPPSSHDPENR